MVSDAFLSSAVRTFTVFTFNFRQHLKFMMILIIDMNIAYDV